MTDINIVIKLRKQNKSMTEIASAFGVSKQCIQQLVARHAPNLCGKRSSNQCPRGKRIQKKCLHCGTQFEVVPSRRSQIYCSSKCSGKPFDKNQRIDEIRSLRREGRTWTSIDKKLGIGSMFSFRFMQHVNAQCNGKYDWMFEIDCRYKKGRKPCKNT